MDSDPWKDEGRPAHRDLLDERYKDFISYLPREAVIPFTKWWHISRFYDRPDIRETLEHVLRLAPSIDGRRAQEVVQSLQPRPDLPGEHRDHVRHETEPGERDRRRDRV